MAPTAGELVTEALEYDGGRLVTVYVPSEPAEAIVFAADGRGTSRGSAMRSKAPAHRRR